MALDKAVKHGKEFRKSFRKAQAVDCTCRNNGSCPHCRNNRLHKFIVKEEKAKSIEKDFKSGG